MTGFPQSTVDSLVSQNRNLQGEISRLLQQNRSLETDLEKAKRKVIELDIIDKERESDFQRLESQFRQLKSEHFTISRDRDSAEKQLALTLEEYESAKTQFSKVSQQASRFRRLYFSLKRRLRIHIRTAWDRLKKENIQVTEKEKRLQIKLSEMKRNLEEMTSYIQKRNQEYKKELEEAQSSFDTRMSNLESETNNLKKELEKKIEENKKLEVRSRDLRSLVTRLENSALKRKREESESAKDLLDRYENGQSRIFALMTENRDLKEKVKRLESNIKRTHLEAEEAKDKWAKEKVEMTEVKDQAREQLISTEAFVKSLKETAIDGEFVDDIRNSLRQLEGALSSLLIPDGQNESFNEVSFQEENTSDSEPKGTKEESPYASIDDDLLRISSYMG